MAQRHDDSPMPEMPRGSDLEQALNDLSKSMGLFKKRLERVQEELQTSAARMLAQADRVARLARGEDPGDKSADPMPLSLTGPDDTARMMLPDDFDPDTYTKAEELTEGAQAALNMARTTLKQATASGTYRKSQEKTHTLQEDMAAIGINSFPDGDVPLLPVVVYCNEAYREIHKFCEQLQNTAQTPESKSPVGHEIVTEIMHARERLFHDFNVMQTTARSLVRKRFDSLRDKLPRDADPKLFWGSDLATSYLDYRCSRFVELFLDAIERELLKEEKPVYYEIVDHAAKLMGLERIPIEIGKANYHAYFHQLCADQADRGIVPDDLLVTGIRRSGYTDTKRNRIARRILVVVDASEQEKAREEEEKRLKLLEAAHRTTISSTRRVLSLDEQVKRTRTYVFKLRMSALSMVNGGKIPGTNKPFDPAFSALVTTCANDYLKSFLSLGNTQKQAEPEEGEDEIDPEEADAALAKRYADFRTVEFVEQILDPLEREIIKRDLGDHMAVITHLGMEMDLGRMEVLPGKSHFDPSHHEVDTRYGSVGDRFQKIVGTVIRSGYVDLLSAGVIRKAIVRIANPRDVQSL